MAGTHTADGVRAPAAEGTWGTALELPGTAALNRGGDAVVRSVSCVGAGNCSAGGSYRDSVVVRDFQAFVASEVNGTWQKAIEMPGTAGLNRGGNAAVYSVSCASAGTCSAGGDYADASGRLQAFVAIEVTGTWQKAIRVPGTGTLNQGGTARITSVSCASAGNCSAGGSYTDAARRLQAFVASEVSGTWHTAIEVPGTAALNQGGNAEVRSVSCGLAGDCSAGGYYTDGSGAGQAFVASEVNGTWHTAIEVPGTAALHQGGGNAQSQSVSCSSAGNCSAGGDYRDGSGHYQAFVASEVNGTWHTAIEVPGTAALNQDGAAALQSVSCGSAGNCSAAGNYTDGAGHQQAFVASEMNGSWHTAIEIPGTAALSQGDGAGISSVSCGSTGNCSAGGVYSDGSGRQQAFVASEVNGIWGTAVEVPGTAALNQGGGAGVFSVSCGSAGNCGGGGFYKDASGSTQAFVVNEA